MQYLTAKDGCQLAYTKHTPDAAFQYSLVFVHGAGFTGSCWRPLSSLLNGHECIVVELRGHGKSGGDCSELTLETLLSDLHHFFDLPSKQTVLVGHSLGGSLAARVAHEWPHCVGVVMLDITEESAIRSVSIMESFLLNRPQVFPSLETAAGWMFKTKHATAAMTECAADQLIEKDGTHRWRMSLIDSKDHWFHWFQGMDAAFLQAPVDIKILLLAGDNEQLDGPLTRGQMQGKFQLGIIPRSTHALMLEAPQDIASIINESLRRHQLLGILNRRK
jgi:pimeloyl-ACP methyl ester carboxylesterase